MTTPAPAITDLPDLDAQVCCEYGSHCACTDPHRCTTPAVWRVRLHGARFPHEACCYNFTMLLCEQHLTQIRAAVEDILRHDENRRCDCGRPMRQVSDVILVVNAL